MSTNNVIELLVKVGVLDDRQHDAVMSRSRSGAGGDLVRQVADLGYATESTVARILSVELGLPRVDLAMTPPEHEALALLDLKTCTDRFVLPVALRENGELLWLAMGDPTDSESMALVRRKSGKRVRPVVAGPSEITREARKLYAAPQTPGHFENLEDSQLDQGPMDAIELGEAPAGQAEEAFEIVNVADESAAPLERLAEQLGVPVPESISRRGREAEPSGTSSAGGGAGYGELEIAGASDAGDDGATQLEARPMLVTQPPPPPPSSRPNLSAAGPRGVGPAGKSTSPGASPPPPSQTRVPSRPTLQAQGSRPPPPTAPPAAPPPGRTTQQGAGQPVVPGPPLQPRSPAAALPPTARVTSAGVPRPVPPTLQLSQPPVAPQPTGNSGTTALQRGVRSSQLGAMGSTATPRNLSLAPETRPPPPAAPPAPQMGALEAVFAVPPAHGPAEGALSSEDLATLEALRTSMEKGALVLRAVAELCVDKGLFTREEMKSRAK